MDLTPKGTLSPASVNVPAICTMDLPQKRKRKRDRLVSDIQIQNKSQKEKGETTKSKKSKKSTKSKKSKKFKKSKNPKKATKTKRHNVQCDEGQKRKRKKKGQPSQEMRECECNSKNIQGLVNRICALEQKVDHACSTVANSSTATTPMLSQQSPVPAVMDDKTLRSTVDTLQAELLRLTRFSQLQTKRNNINVNLFAVILNELSLKLNMKGRLKEDRNDGSLPLSIGSICSLKSEAYDEIPTVEHAEGGIIEGHDSTIKKDIAHMQSCAMLDDMSTKVLEAAAISISGQTVTSIDDKNTHRIKQIRDFKRANGIPINGLVSFKKNVTRFNQDAGLACEMTLTANMQDGMHVCFGNDTERIAVHCAQMLNDNDVDMNVMNVDMEAICSSDNVDNDNDNFCVAEVRHAACDIEI